MAEMTNHKGGCHCGKVRYEASVDLGSIIACNCSICTKAGLYVTFTKASNFKLISGKDDLKDYQFGKKWIHHLHCTNCGVESFARGDMPSDGTPMVAVNVRCLDDIDLDSLTLTPYDGKSL